MDAFATGPGTGPARRAASGMAARDGAPTAWTLPTRARCPAPWVSSPFAGA